MGTLDAHLIALTQAPGASVRDVQVANHEEAYSLTLSPLVIKDKVSSACGRELGIRGFIAAHDVRPGKTVEVRNDT